MWAFRRSTPSYHSFMWNNFFSHIDIVKENVHILNGNAPDLKAECEAYEAAIVAAGGIDLFMGGIGEDSHIAFNEPFSSLSSRTREDPHRGYDPCQFALLQQRYQPRAEDGSDGGRGYDLLLEGGDDPRHGPQEGARRADGC